MCEPDSDGCWIGRAERDARIDDQAGFAEQVPVAVRGAAREEYAHGETAVALGLDVRTVADVAAEQERSTRGDHASELSYRRPEVLVRDMMQHVPAEHARERAFRDGDLCEGGCGEAAPWVVGACQAEHGSRDVDARNRQTA